MGCYTQGAVWHPVGGRSDAAELRPRLRRSSPKNHRPTPFRVRSSPKLVHMPVVRRGAHGGWFPGRSLAGGARRRDHPLRLRRAFWPPPAAPWPRSSTADPSQHQGLHTEQEKRRKGEIFRDDHSPPQIPATIPAAGSGGPSPAHRGSKLLLLAHGTKK